MESTPNPYICTCSFFSEIQYYHVKRSRTWNIRNVVLVDLYDTSLLLMTQNQKPFINMTPTHTYITRNRKLVSSPRDKVRHTSTCTYPITETSTINLTIECKRYMSQSMKFPTMRYVRPAKPQISLRIRAVWSEPSLVAWVFYDC